MKWIHEEYPGYGLTYFWDFDIPEADRMSAKLDEKRLKEQARIGMYIPTGQYHVTWGMYLLLVPGAEDMAFTNDIKLIQ